ncbi:hypothetical protein L873DRAFT_1800918 [Choiromyces venosus 120613-1]|uniref:Uncharacterized protein n=1 Tax=Choiromyces venosus 120613-1 TaxID=1336337 RepID=A0A3N4JZ48_9PEZI|nr:hypothetical protein L873DRAFT_1800918 [Choiromyces venosus 120613-1]
MASLHQAKCSRVQHIMKLQCTMWFTVVDARLVAVLILVTSITGLSVCLFEN